MNCMHHGCPNQASGMVGFYFYPNPADAAFRGLSPTRALAQASSGLAFCPTHFTALLTQNAQTLLQGHAVHAAETIIARQFDCPVAHELTEIVLLELTNPTVQLREQMLTGYVHRPFETLIPTGALLN